jgi:hypothetical protein
LCTIFWHHNVGRGCDEIGRIIKVGYAIRDEVEMKIKLGDYKMLE